MAADALAMQDARALAAMLITQSALNISVPGGKGIKYLLAKTMTDYTEVSWSLHVLSNLLI